MLWSKDGVQIRTFKHALAWAPELIALAPEEDRRQAALIATSGRRLNLPLALSGTTSLPRPSAPTRGPLPEPLSRF